MKGTMPVKGERYCFWPADIRKAAKAFELVGSYEMDWENDGYRCRLEGSNDYEELPYYDMYVGDDGTYISDGEVVDVIASDAAAETVTVNYDGIGGVAKMTFPAAFFARNFGKTKELDHEQSV
jgi:hypothetical protein